MSNEPTAELAIWEQMSLLWQMLQTAKPAERNEIARRYAVTMTEFEKVMGYYNTFVIEGLSQDVTT